MTARPETSLRVRFAKAMGWQHWKSNSGKVKLLGPKYLADHGQYFRACGESETTDEINDFRNFASDALFPVPDPNDANTVREALMGMTEKEWKQFSLIYCNQKHFDFDDELSNTLIVEYVLKEPPTTLAELICEVRNVSK